MGSWEDPCVVIDVDAATRSASSTDASGPGIHQASASSLLPQPADGGADAGTAACSTFLDGGKEAPIVSFFDLRYSVEINKKKETLEILQGISGVYGDRGGELVAIMGQSGAGKTTLLNVLAQRASGIITGRVVVNGAPLRRTTAKKLIGYIHQQDEHFPELTVLETLLFMAGLTMPKSSQEEREAHVWDVMACLNLAQIAQSPVGHATSSASMARGISGGERKRLSIAGALIHDPQILLLDEYTSGLDSETALEVTNMLKTIARRGRTIISTVHQPSSQIFYAFDKLHLLTMGRTVYFGPSKDVVPYFDALGDAFKCPPYFNPAEHVQRLAFAMDDSTGSGTANDLVAHYAASEERKLLRQKAETLDRAAKRRDFKVSAAAVAGIGQQFWWLCWRNARLFYRNKLKTKVKLIINVMLGLILGLIYFDVPNSYTGISDRNFFMLQLAVVVGVRQSMETLSFFLREKVVYLRQVEQGLYGVFPYLSSRFLVELPQMLFFPLVFCTIALPLVDLNYEGGNFFIFWAAVVMLILNAYSFGLAIGTVITDPDILSVVAPMVVFPFLIFSGLTAVNIPPAISWIENIVYLRYGMLAILRTEYEGQEFYQGCTAEEFRNGSDACTIITGEEILQEFNMDFVSVGEAFAVLVGLFCAAFAIAVTCLSRLSRKRQG